MANYVPRLKEKYLKEIRTGLKEKFSYKNDMMIPKLQKIAAKWPQMTPKLSKIGGCG